MGYSSIKIKIILSVSPDSLIRDNKIIEIKCPPSIKSTTPQEAAKINKIKYLIVNKNREVELKHTIYNIYTFMY